MTGVEISAVLDDGTRRDLGGVALNRDGTLGFAAAIGAHRQGSLVATEADAAGGTATSADHRPCHGGPPAL